MFEIYKLIKFRTLGCCIHNSYFFATDKLFWRIGKANFLLNICFFI